jgi:hypothetical protein
MMVRCKDFSPFFSFKVGLKSSQQTLYSDLASRGKASILRSQVQPGNEDLGGSTSPDARF